jgi:hypothetical protein
MNLFHRKKRTHLSSATASRLRRQRRQRPGLESLEGRQLMSLTSGTFQVNTRQGLSDNNSDTASSPGGIRVVAWEDGYSNTDHDIYAQMYNPDGSRRGGQIAVETNTAFQSSPRVAMDANGDFVVVWQEDVSHLPSDGLNDSNDSIVARTFDSNGNALTGRISIAFGPGGIATNVTPDVAMDAAGNFVVTWTQVIRSRGGETPSSTVWYREQNLFGGFLANSPVGTTGDFQTSPSVAMNASDRFDIAYMDGGFDGHGISNPSIRVAEFDVFADRISDQELFATAGSGYDPSISMDNNGNAVIAYATIHSFPPPPRGWREYVRHHG